MPIEEDVVRYLEAKNGKGSQGSEQLFLPGEDWGMQAEAQTHQLSSVRDSGREWGHGEFLWRWQLTLGPDGG